MKIASSKFCVARHSHFSTSLCSLILPQLSPSMQVVWSHMMVFPWRRMFPLISLSLSSSPFWLLQALLLQWHALHSTVFLWTRSEWLVYLPLHHLLGKYELYNVVTKTMFSLQADTYEQPKPELPDRGWCHHLVYGYLFVYHPHHRPTSSDCVVQCYPMADCSGLLFMLWHHSCQDG